MTLKLCPFSDYYLALPKPSQVAVASVFGKLKAEQE